LAEIEKDKEYQRVRKLNKEAEKELREMENEVSEVVEDKLESMTKGEDYEILSEHEDTQKFHVEDLKGLVKGVDYELLADHAGLTQNKDDEEDAPEVNGPVME
jgi:hypothetical protein